jgi:hypothetical protein
MTFPELWTFPENIDEKILSPVYIRFSSSNYPLPRRTGTRVLREFTLSYDDTTFLNASDRLILIDFFNTHVGIPFDWTHPETGETITVFFNMESLSINSIYTMSNAYTTELVLREV